MDLINQLVSSLGVSEEQAKGGAGMLFKLAQDKLSGDEFAQIADKVSGLDDMVSTAPDAEGGGLMGAVGGLVSKMGGGSTELGPLASFVRTVFERMEIADQVSQEKKSSHPLQADLIDRSFPLPYTYFQKKSAGDLLKGVLSSN